MIDYVTREVRAGGAAPAAARSTAFAALRQFGFSRETASAPTGQMSPEDRQRASLARVFAKKPRLLLLDEPSEHLLERYLDTLESELNKVKRAGAGVLIACRHATRLGEFADEIITLPELSVSA